MDYTEFKIEEQRHKHYRVYVKRYFMWWSGFVWTDYFDVYYTSLDSAKYAIDGYKNRNTFISIK